MRTLKDIVETHNEARPGGRPMDQEDSKAVLKALEIESDALGLLGFYLDQNRNARIILREMVSPAIWADHSAYCAGLKKRAGTMSARVEGMREAAQVLTPNKNFSAQQETRIADLYNFECLLFEIAYRAGKKIRAISEERPDIFLRGLYRVAVRAIVSMLEAQED